MLQTVCKLVPNICFPTFLSFSPCKKLYCFYLVQ